jgi:hypothetical protein
VRRTATVGFFAVCLVLAAAGSATSSASTMARAKTHWKATEAGLPGDAATGANQNVSIYSVSCASAGSCSAVGTYLDGSGQQEGLLLTEKSGKWRRGVRATLPGNAGSGVYLSSVSCASAGNCAAVGWYSNGGLLLTEKAGKWLPGVEAALPADAESSDPAVVLHSVSCGSAGNCSAVGSYEAASGRKGVLLSEKAGTWRTGIEVALPEGNGDLNAVSCVSAGNCSAVGASGDEGLLLTEKAGKWRRGTVAALPDDAIAGRPVTLTSISCASAGNCSAVGTYNNPLTGRDQEINGGVLLTEKAGKWRTGVRSQDPRNSLLVLETDLNSVSCASAGECAAVGDYLDDQAVQPLLLTERAGKWRTGVEANLPGNAGLTDSALLSSVSCASAGSCAAVGSYQDVSGGERGLLVTETAGKWRTGVEATLPSRAHAPAVLTSLSCASALDCSAVGSYGGSGSQGLLLDRPAKPCVVPELKGETLRGAKRSIESHDCSLGKIDHARSGTIESGRVISQSPRAGKRLDHGAKVDVVVSEGTR